MVVSLLLALEFQTVVHADLLGRLFEQLKG
jgi:hypothetical protein